MWTSYAFLAAGAGPSAVCDPALEKNNTAQAHWFPDGHEAEDIASIFREFSARQFAMVERALHGRLLAAWESIPAVDRPKLRWHFICTGKTLAGDEDNRWFCRVSLEIIAGGVSQADARDGGAWGQWRQPWPTTALRQSVAVLTAEHVCGGG
jgi:hypothetical protein